MIHRRTRPFATALMLAALAAGCGGIGDEQQPPFFDATTAADRPVAATDGIVPLPDSGEPRADATPALDSTAPDTQVSEAGGDGGGSPEPSGLDGGNSADAGGADLPPRPPTTIVVLPDTQYYSSSYPEVFSQQTDWILEHRAALNIAAVLHVGDLVDGDTTAQWTVAKTAMRVLDGLIPYVVSTGNHDTDGNRKSMINDFFGPTTMPWISGTMVPGQIENSYAVLNIGGRPWLVLSLEFGPRDAVVVWADTILNAYPTTPAILLTHAYLYRDGTRYDITKGGTDASKPNYQYFNPVTYGFTASQGINDGEMLWQKLVLPNPNLRLVFCGHDTGWARLSSARPDGSVVHQMLSDSQWLDARDFGFGYLRTVQFDYAKKTLSVQTYSPYLGSYLTDGDNQFTLELAP